MSPSSWLGLGSLSYVGSRGLHPCTTQGLFQMAYACEVVLKHEFYAAIHLVFGIVREVLHLLLATLLLAHDGVLDQIVAGVRV